MKSKTEILTEGKLPDKEAFKEFEDLCTLFLLFAATQNRDYLEEVLKTLRRIDPEAGIIGASSDEAIAPGKIVGNGKVIITALGFEHTKVRTASAASGTDGGELAKEVLQKNTKLLIAFSDAASVNGELFLDQMYKVCPDVAVTGGVAATPTFSDTFVIESDRILSSGIAVASLSSDILHVKSGYSFGWQAVGRSFKITEVHGGNRVVSISNTPSLRLFAKYLGKEVVAAMPGLGSAFPLMIKRGDMLIARGILAVEDESFIVSGNVKEGDTAYIGYGNAHTIIDRNDLRRQIADSLPDPDVILNFYCMGRKLFLPPSVVEYEEQLLDTLAPVCGMFTLGEFHGDGRFDLLNFSSTAVALKEGRPGRKYSLEPIAPPVIDDLGLVAEGLFNFIEVRARELEYMAYHDELTGLPNRARFTEILERAIHRLDRTDSTGAIFFIDLDNFKNINDTAGHDEGDKVLKLIAQRLKKRVNKGMSVCRFGGDEFIIIAEKIGNDAQTALFAEKILGSLKEKVEVGIRSYHLTASMGVTFFFQGNTDMQELLKQADIAMYRSKMLGKNRWSIYTESMGLHALENYRLQQDLRRGIKNRELILHYQPQYDIESGKIVSIEALVRWNHPEKGLLYPDSFIEVAESSGLIVEFGEIVLDMALEFLAECKGVDRVAVNISSKQFNDTGFFSMIKRMLKKYGLGPENLELEMTESVVMDDDSETTELLFALARDGITLSIDDFGTGYSSLSYLKRMPIGTLKIDRSFVMDIPSDKSGVAIVKSIVAMAKALDLKLVAEGIETKEQVEFFRREGGVVVQGYFYSKPLPPAKIRRLLES